MPGKHIIRKAFTSRFSWLSDRAIPEPLIAGRATCTALTLSFYNPLFNAKEESPAAQGIIL